MTETNLDAKERTLGSSLSPVKGLQKKWRQREDSNLLPTV